MLRIGWLLVGRGLLRFGTRGLLLALLSATRDMMRQAALHEIGAGTDGASFADCVVGDLERVGSPSGRRPVLRVLWAPITLGWLARRFVGRRRVSRQMLTELRNWIVGWYEPGRQWEIAHGQNPLHPPVSAVER
jgi:hypothetical protein